MTFPLPPNATIGLVGGGQLGRMSALAAARLGYRCHILTRERDSPASQVSAAATISDYQEPDGLREFAAAVDVISFEFENVSAEGLDLLASLKPVRPSPAILRTSQDRILEKSFLNGAGVPTASWLPVGSLAELRAAVERIGLPAVLKTTRLGYDGKGQAMLRQPEDVADAFAALSPKPLILEGFIDFAQEISVVAARGANGAYTAFDAVENRHRSHILDLTLAPARIPEVVDRQAQSIARRVADALDLVGLLAVEMFVDAHGRGPGERDRPSATQLRALDDRRLPGEPVRDARSGDRRPAAAASHPALGRGHEEPGRSGRGCTLAGGPRHAGADPAPLRQDGGATRPQDGSCDAAVHQGGVARRVRHRGRTRTGCAALIGRRSVHGGGLGCG